MVQLMGVLLFKGFVLGTASGPLSDITHPKKTLINNGIKKVRNLSKTVSEEKKC